MRGCGAVTSVAEVALSSQNTRLHLLKLDWHTLDGVGQLFDCCSSQHDRNDLAESQSSNSKNGFLACQLDSSLKPCLDIHELVACILDSELIVSINQSIAALWVFDPCLVVKSSSIDFGFELLNHSSIRNGWTTKSIGIDSPRARRSLSIVGPPILTLGILSVHRVQHTPQLSRSFGTG